MKKFKNKILSVLLLSFSILIIHDYVIVDTNTKHESSYVESNQKTGDSTSLVHSQIHLSMDMPLVETIYISAPLHSKKIFDYQIGNTSYIHSVLQRPPLS